MTLSDFLKRVKNCPSDSAMLFVDENGGWTNIDIKIEKSTIKILADRRPLFHDD